MNNAGVRITNTRAIISGTTYAMANITSVRASTTPAKRGGAINCIILGAILLLIGLAASTLACDVLGIILIAIGILVLRSKKDIHTVMIVTAGGEVDAVSSTNRNYIVSIVAAMNNAITHRG